MSAVAKSRELDFALRPGSRSRPIERPKGRVGTIRVIDAARMLIAAGCDPDSWLEGWRPGTVPFALKAATSCFCCGLAVTSARARTAATLRSRYSSRLHSC
jgi:hypothetical protein